MHLRKAKQNPFILQGFAFAGGWGGGRVGTSPWDRAFPGTVVRVYKDFSCDPRGLLPGPSGPFQMPSAFLLVSMAPHPYQTDCLQRPQLVSLVSTPHFSVLWPRVALAMCCH